MTFTVTPNLSLLNDRRRVVQDRDPYLVETIDMLQTQFASPTQCASIEDLYDSIQMIIYDLLKNHTAQEAARTNNQSRRQFTKPRIDEFALIVHYFLPIRRIKLSTNSAEIGFYQFSGSGEGTYVIDRNDTDDSLLTNIIYKIWPNTTVSDLRGYTKAITAIATTVTETKDPQIVIVNNGLYHKDTKSLTDFDPDYVSLTKIATDYNPNATLINIHNDNDNTDWDVDSWLKDLAGANANQFDQDTYDLFWQIIAATINPSSDTVKAIFFYSSEGNNGKGTYGQLLKNIVGKNNYSSLPIPGFKHEYLKEQLIGKTLNIADENPVDMYIDDVQDFKAYITGDDISFNRKYKSPLAMQFHAVNIQMLNGLPRTKDKSDSFYRRILLVPFLVSFTNNGERPYIKSDYINRKEVKEYVLYKALTMPSFSAFTEPARSKQAMVSYKEENDPVIEFWNEMESQFQWDLLPTKFLYDLYKAWFNETTPKGICIGRKAFLKQLKTYLKYDPNWDYIADSETCPQAIRIGNRMAADEPLITEYNITSYMDTTAALNNPVKRRNFTRPTTARGILRVHPKNP